jgi:hypothetical protein
VVERERGVGGGGQGWPAHQGCVRRGCGRRALIRPICITILYCNLLLFIDIFHI